MKYALIVLLLFSSDRVHAYDQTFESCSMTAWEILDAIDKYRLGVPLEKARSLAGTPQNVEIAYDLAKESLETAYMAAHVQFRKCAGEVENGAAVSLPAKEQAYRECAWTSATRTNILIALVRGTSIDEVRSTVPPQLHALVDTLYRTAEEDNPTKALAVSAESLRECVSETVEAFP